MGQCSSKLEVKVQVTVTSAQPEFTVRPGVGGWAEATSRVV